MYQMDEVQLLLHTTTTIDTQQPFLLRCAVLEAAIYSYLQSNHLLGMH
jgi:hypothetical protein